MTNLLDVPKDVLIMMMVDLDLPEVSKLCISNKKFNTILCENPIFWRQRIEKEYPKVDISNVKDYKGLYNFLKRKIHMGRNWGDLSKNGLAVQGAGGMYYAILNDDKTKVSFELERSRVTFPRFPPEYFSTLGTNIFALNFKKSREAIDNLNKNISYIFGDFREKYPVVFKFGNMKEDKIRYILKYLKMSSSPHVVRYINGDIILDLAETDKLI